MAEEPSSLTEIQNSCGTSLKPAQAFNGSSRGALRMSGLALSGGHDES